MTQSESSCTPVAQRTHRVSNRRFVAILATVVFVVGVLFWSAHRMKTAAIAERKAEKELEAMGASLDDWFSWRDFFLGYRLGAVNIEANLSGIRDINSAMEHVPSLTGLEHLNLSETEVNDRDLARIAGLRNLTSLQLTGTQVTDAGLPHLYGLGGLRSLDIDKRHITDAGIEELQARLPKLNVTLEPAE
ncbi:MAG: hypothetical protein WDZ59_16910 [Pirellulales bacterium]